MATLSTSGIETGQTIQASQITQIVTALNGGASTDINIQGNLRLGSITDVETTLSGFSNSSGTSGDSGSSGSSGTSGATGSPGSNGSSGTSGTTPAIGGSNTYVQFNTSGALGGSSTFTWNGTSNYLYVGGRIGIGTSSPSYPLHVTTQASNISIYASYNIVAYSDARSKTNVETIDNALEKVSQMRGVTYNKVEDPEGASFTGVIAQEVLPHLPEAVLQGEDGHYSVAYGNMVGILIEAIKELKAEIDELKASK